MVSCPATASAASPRLSVPFLLALALRLSCPVLPCHCALQSCSSPVQLSRPVPSFADQCEHICSSRAQREWDFLANCGNDWMAIRWWQWHTDRRKSHPMCQGDSSMGINTTIRITTITSHLLSRVPVPFASTSSNDRAIALDSLDLLQYHCNCQQHSIRSATTRLLLVTLVFYADSYCATRYESIVVRTQAQEEEEEWQETFFCK